MRDLSKAQMTQAAARHGIWPDYCGYWDIGQGILIYAGNAGDLRRSQLAYLIAEQRRHDGQQVGTASGTPYGIVGGFAVEPIT